MESPTYSGALSLARFAGVEIIPLPMGPEGPDPSALLGRRVKIVYLMPERQNPTGVTTPDARRDELLEAAASAGALVVEDGYEEPESGHRPLAARQPERTIWRGTLSKDLVPGFRIGWLAGPGPVIERLARVKRTVPGGPEVQGWLKRPDHPPACVRERDRCVGPAQAHPHALNYRAK